MVVLSQIDLSIKFGEGSSARTENIMFDVFDIPYQYNFIPVRATLNAFGAVVHHNYLCMKSPSLGGIIMVSGMLEAMAQVLHVHMVEQNSTKQARPMTSKGDMKRVSLSEGSLTKIVA